MRGIFFALRPNTFEIWCVSVRDVSADRSADPEEHHMAAAPRTIRTQPSVQVPFKRGPEAHRGAFRSPEDRLTIAGADLGSASVTAVTTHTCLCSHVSMSWRHMVEWQRIPAKTNGEGAAKAPRCSALRSAAPHARTPHWVEMRPSRADVCAQR